MSDTSLPNKLLTAEQLAAAIQYHPESVRRMIRARLIRALPFGKHWRIPREEYERILLHGLPHSEGGNPA